MEDDRIEQPAEERPLDEDGRGWFRRLPWKPVGLVLIVLLLWLLIGVACPPSLWRF
jgi:hypothetical protein